MKNFAKKLYLFLIILFLYMPIFVLVVASFNDSKLLGTWKGFTLRWYRQLFDDAQTMTALKNTLVLAVIAAFAATILGTLAALTVSKMRRLPKAFITNITNIPMLNAEIVTGLAFMLLFVGVGVSLSFSTVLIAHITFCIPYAMMSVLPKVAQIDHSMYEAALDLGASRSYAFFKITLPDIFPSRKKGEVVRW